MTLRTELQTDPLGLGYAQHLPNGEAALMALLNDKTRTVPFARDIGNGSILETIGLAAGNALLDVINNVSDFRHVKPLVEQGRLVSSSPLVIATIQSLVPSVLTQAQANALIALGTTPASRAEELGLQVNITTLRQAIWNDDGTRTF